MEQRAITQMEKSKKMEKAEEKFRQQTAIYEKACKEEKDKVRKIEKSISAAPAETTIMMMTEARMIRD
ncbi:MAG: hypothetical protein IJT96_03910 [Lachnospiraceae bacterium]|nr:hypothetical protein [Lachnospiraceae bacterium]